jgi:UDP-GlcNAc:undecaprenyl-phosphate/decaprenyl-phosphate GlcNAc-1-phosphate transferase
MNTYLTLFLISLSASLFLTPVIRRLAQRLGWLDVPDRRRTHAAPIPRLGGVAVFVSVMLALGALPLVDNLVTRTLVEQWPRLVAVLASSTIVFMFGVFDDLAGASAKWKFIAQGVAAVILYLLGGHIGAITIPFAGSFHIPPVLDFAFTILWVVGISNAFNLIDGLDGLATGASLFAALVILGVSLINAQPIVTVVSITLAGALIGFLRYNFNPASIFLGDSGALFIGFLLAALSVTGVQKASTAVAVAIPLMTFALPVIDTGFAVARRFISGKPLFEGDREHIHHKLLELGWSQRRVAFALYGACALFGMLALLFTSDGGSGKLTGLVLLITGAAVVLIVGRLRYHEVDEVRASVKRNVFDRRARAANNLVVRRASRALVEATTLGKLFDAVEQVLALDEFAYASVRLGHSGDVEAGARAFGHEERELAARGAYLADGLVHWRWVRADVDPLQVQDSPLYWTLRLPLATESAGWGFITFYREFDSESLLLDVNHLSSFFQREMARAVERVLTRAEVGSVPVAKAVGRGALMSG